jgi:hypothetical protein
MKRILAGWVGAAIGLGCGTADAQLQTYHRVGAWEAFSGRGDSGGAVCGIGTTITADNRRLSIRFDIGGSETNFSAGKPEWNIPADAHVTVVMQIGLNAPWTVQASGQGHDLAWTLDPGAMQSFDRQFRGAPSMTLAFPDGNEPPWSLSLTGSTAISDTFGRCVRDLTRQVEAASQVGSGAAPPPQGATQPFAPPAR